MNNESRFRLIDEKLSEGVYLAGVTSVTRLLNINRAKNERAINDERTKQLIGEFKELVREKGVELKHSKSSGYRYSVHGFRYFQDSVTENDKNLLLIANSLFSIFSGTGMHERFGYVVNNILKSKNRKGPVEGISRVKMIDTGGDIQDPGVKWLQPIVRSIMEVDLAIEVEYKKSEIETKIRILSPYIVKQFEGKWYMVAYDHTGTRNAKTNVFALAKIQSVGFSNKKFYFDPQFSAEDYFNHSIGIWHSHTNSPIKVRFQILDAELYSGLMQVPLHKTQTLISPTEKILEIDVYDTPELLTLFLRNAANIKVISPEPFVTRLRDEFKRAATLYS